MEVLNDSSTQIKQYLFEPAAAEFKGFDSFWDPAIAFMVEPDACAGLPLSSCSSSWPWQEASSRTGSPDESLSSHETVSMRDRLCHSSSRNTAAARTLSCHPLIRKSSKKPWPPSTHNTVRKELPYLLADYSHDELVHAVSTPLVINPSLTVDSCQKGVFTGIHVKDEDSSLIESHGSDELPYLHSHGSSIQSFEDGSLAYAYTQSPAEAGTSISLAGSENSISDSLLGSSEILQSVAYDDSTVLEFVAAPSGFETWLEDPFPPMSVLQAYTDDGDFISYPKQEESMVNTQSFLLHDSMAMASNESIKAPGHLRIDHLEENHTQPHNLTQVGTDLFCLPKPSLGPIHTNSTLQSLQTLHDAFNTCSASFNGVTENKLHGKYTDSRQLSYVCEDTSKRYSCCGYGSIGSAAQQNQISVKKENSRLDVDEARGWGSTTMNVFSQIDRRMRGNYCTEMGLIHLLAAGVEAVARRDTDAASVMLGQLKDMVSSSGSTMQRVMGYFIHSLEHQQQADGSNRGIIDHMSMKSQGDILAAFQILHEIFPYIKFAHFTANQAILEAVQAAKRVHIIDFEIMEGIQWPAFMQALISRQEGPPELHITALCRPHWQHGLAMVQKTGTRLSEFASSMGLSFTFDLLKTDNNESFNPKHLKLSDGETLVANCMVHLPHMPRRSTASVTSFLHGMRQLSPTIITVVEEELACHTSTAAISYLSEAVHHFHSLCDSLEACLPAQREARMLVERVFMAPRIDSAMAMWSQTTPSSRSAHRIELADKQKWSTVMHAAGFKPRPFSYHSHSQAKLLLGLHRDGFFLEERSHYQLVLGWQSKPLFAASVWNQ